MTTKRRPTGRFKRSFTVIETRSVLRHSEFLTVVTATHNGRTGHRAHYCERRGLPGFSTYLLCVQYDRSRSGLFVLSISEFTVSAIFNSIYWPMNSADDMDVAPLARRRSVTWHPNSGLRWRQLASIADDERRRYSDVLDMIGQDEAANGDRGDHGPSSSAYDSNHQSATFVYCV